MNSNTRNAMMQFVNDIQILAQGVVHMTGVKDCELLLKNGEHLKECLAKDETIPD